MTAVPSSTLLALTLGLVVVFCGAVSISLDTAPEEKHPDLQRLQQLFDIHLLGPRYLSIPTVSPMLVQAVNSSGPPRPSFSQVYSFFDAGQKGTDPVNPGTWFRHKTITLVLSYHYGCPVQIYKLHEGKLTSELLGNPLENADFKPTVILWAGDLQTSESLCDNMFTFVSYVSVTGWSPEGGENLLPEQLLRLFPEQAEEITRLADPVFNADQSPLAPEVYNGEWAPQ